MLEVAADDAAHMDVVGHTGHPGPQTADAAHHEVDFDAGLRRLQQDLDELRVDQAVHLHHDAAAVRNLVLHALEQCFSKRVGRDEQPPVADRAAVAGERVEQVGAVLADLGICGEQPDVLVEPRRAGVVVAGTDMTVPTDAVGLVADDQAHLGVDLVSDDAVGDVHACLLESPRRLDVRPLVEARLQFDEHRDLFAFLGRVDQRLDDRAVAGGAIDRDLDREHAWVVGGLADEVHHRPGERRVGVMHEHVTVSQDREDAARIVVVVDESGLGHAGPRLVEEIGPPQGRELEQRAEVDERR